MLVGSWITNRRYHIIIIINNYSVPPSFILVIIKTQTLNNTIRVYIPKIWMRTPYIYAKREKKKKKKKKKHHYKGFPKDNILTSWVYLYSKSTGTKLHLHSNLSPCTGEILRVQKDPLNTPNFPFHSLCQVLLPTSSSSSRRSTTTTAPRKPIPNIDP